MLHKLGGLNVTNERFHRNFLEDVSFKINSLRKWKFPGTASQREIYAV